jgi:hypothetical protein
MELAEGDLHHFFENNEIYVASNPIIFLQMLESIRRQLLCLLNLGYVYTDIKLGNILYKCDDPNNLNGVRFMLGDLGSAVLDKNGQSVFTYLPYYLPYRFRYGDTKLQTDDEKIMSLNKDSFYDNNKYELEIDKDKDKIIIEYPVFFFIYNFDNYYHFLYDTLPYLYTYLELKKNNPELKLLVNYPNKNKKDFYKFNSELLEKIINLDDLIIHNENYNYKELYVSTSLTHGGYSNNPPRKEIYEIYNLIKKNINYQNIDEKYNNLNKVYISRRTWINNDNTNIGTDYTSRRKMVNEDELVNQLIKYDFTEIFAENLNTDEKIYLFSNADIIVGSIGGGMANLLFSNKNTKSIVIATPFFLDINYRFKYSMEHTNINYIYDVHTYLESNTIPLYCRVNIIDEKSKYYQKYGEISQYNKDTNKYLINISNNDVAGFNNVIKFDNEWFLESEFILLDNGLNSPYLIDINKVLELL